ncbi:MAG TPA: heme exporter protein CcmD [Stellaceae bacterium]|jgi:heme exporter protein D|nr:heme exporter protein CcmD [Stellaceae bacterium]
MTALNQYLAMGGYAGFVWPAYAVATLAIGGISWQSWRRYRASAALLDRMQRQPGRGQ